MFDLTSKSIDIITSRDGIRSELVDYAKTYLELENVDLYYTSFLSYIINVLSILTANQLYYTSTIYKEFFLTEAQLEESVYNLAKWIGYTPATATPATVDILITLPLTFQDPNVSFMIPLDFQVKSDDIIYTCELPLTIKIDETIVASEISIMKSSGINIQVLNNKAVTVRNTTGYFYPVLMNSDTKEASFLVPFTQYELQELTYQVPQDLEIYQFWSVVLQFNGMPWKADVYEVITDETGTVETKLEQAEANSLYTMTASDKKFVFVAGYNKAEIFFGNGVIGKQPTPGSTIKVQLYVTKGESGKVIAGTLTQPSKIYYKYYDESTGITKTLPIKLTTTNPGPAEGGEDSPSISEIKSRAIANLRSKGRFVSEGDYDDLEEILPNTPLADAKPILKRSDIKVNEIMLFTKLKFENMICPTRNIVIPMDSTSVLGLDPIPAGTLVDVDGEIYETLFTMDPNVLTEVVDYQYVINNVNSSPVLETTTKYAQYCYIILTNCNYTKVGNTIQLTLNVTNIPDQIYDFECEMTTVWDGLKYPLVSEIDTEGNLVGFSYTFPDYLDIPLGVQFFRFRISGMVPLALLPSTVDERKTISNYTTSLTIRKNLNNFMMSTITTEYGQYYIHNVPVIRSSYFETEDVDRPSFELKTIQALINNIDINTKRMLTDYINVKCSDTTGKLINMKYNTPSKGIVVSKTQTSVPLSPIHGQQWIVNGKEDPTWFDKQNMIAKWYDVEGWVFYTPSVNDSVWVEDEQKPYVYTSCVWFEPVFDIPFYIEAVVTKDPASISSSSVLVENVKQALLDHFVTGFGIDMDIDRSEIMQIIRSVEGITYVKLIKPEIDIRFKYSVKEDLSFDELLDYTPQLTCFQYDTISISIKEETI